MPCHAMPSSKNEITEIESKIYLIRGQKVMLDFDLAELYRVSTKQLKQQVRRNPNRFPEDFVISLTKQELMILRSQFVTSRFGWGGIRIPPLAFTEQGIAMLSSVLNNQRAAEVNVAIMRTFVQLRAVLFSNRELEERITKLESKYNGQFKLVFDAIREILSSHPVPRKRIIGLEPRD